MYNYRWNQMFLYQIHLSFLHKSSNLIHVKILCHKSIRIIILRMLIIRKKCEDCDLFQLLSSSNFRFKVRLSTITILPIVMFLILNNNKQNRTGLKFYPMVILLKNTELAEVETKMCRSRWSSVLSKENSAYPLTNMLTPN